MLSNLIQIQKRIFQSSADSGHSSQRRTLKLLTLKQRLRILEKADIVTRHNFDEMLCGGELAESYAEVVGVVQGVEEIFVEGVDVLKTGETIEDQRKLFGECFLGKFDLSGVKVCFS
jgi:hypothetical protein